MKVRFIPSQKKRENPPYLKMKDIFFNYITFLIKFKLKHNQIPMEANFQQIDKAINELSFTLDETLLTKFNIAPKNNDLKQLRKKIKKNQIQPEDNNEKALEKVTKMLEELYKNYEIAGKQSAKLRLIKSQVEGTESEKEKVNKQKVMTQNLFNGFKKKYDEEIENAQKIQKEEEVNRKNIIQELQERIKTIQSKYEESGKYKIQKYKENQTLKHELSKYEPHLAASQSLADAQLKKKSIEIEIQMTTLKQKIQMMDNFKNMRIQTQDKLKKSKEVQEKLGTRLAKIEVKEEDHKLSLAKGHLIFQDYKKAFTVLKDILPKKQKQAYNAGERLKKSSQVLNEMKKKLSQMDRQYQKQKNSLQVLLNLQSQLQKQIAQ